MPKASRSRKSKAIATTSVKNEVEDDDNTSNVHIQSNLSETLELLIKATPCRDQLIKEIVSLIGNPFQLTPQCLFLYGHTSTGKSIVIESIAEFLDLPVVVVNCVECYSSNILFQEILQKMLLRNAEYLEGHPLQLSKRCDNMNDFIREFNKILVHCYSGQTFYIILDKAEKLREREGYILSGFLSMQELSGSNVCVILLSEIPWDKYRGASSIRFKEPLTIYFPSYTKDEIIMILCALRPASTDETFYSDYLSAVLGVFFTACRDLRELRHLAEMNYPFYIEPIKKGVATEEDRHKLWKNIQPYLMKSLHGLYLREISGRAWESQLDTNDKDATTKLAKSKPQGQLIELPFYSKFLLIAAYIASYNPSNTDRRFFVKHAGKMKRTIQSMKKNEQKSAHLRGPKAFPMDRMMAIFYSITEGGVAPSAHIFSQISTLVSLQLLAQIGHEDQIDTPRYKCIVSLDFVQAIAKTVQFDIIRYLYDFV